MFSPRSRKLDGDAPDGKSSAHPLIVVGSGIAGLQAALTAAVETEVLLISAGPVERTNSSRAQGGIAAAIGPDDNTELHEQDTYIAGRGLCRPTAVQILVKSAAARIQDLVDIGVPFEDDLGLEGGHSRNRIVHAGGAATGEHVARALAAQVMAHPRIEIMTGIRVRGLWVEDGECIGVLSDAGAIPGRATILATGGAASLWARTTNAPAAVGGGIAAAYKAGARVADMEFTQFHPTALAGTSLLLTEALRGAGAVLLDTHGARFIDELAPRDVVARAIDAQAGTVTLDLRSIDRNRFAGLMDSIGRECGLDPANTPIPVAPAAHYFIGGIVTDLDARTDIDRLYAAGECAATGVHGANRLASNSLLECLVFGRRAAIDAVTLPDVDVPAAAPELGPSEPPPTAELKDALWRDAGLIRDGHGLEQLLEAPHTVVRLIAEAALTREESRGVHFRADFPFEDEHFHAHVVQRRGQEPVLEAWA
jgi:L-aspartate oxidase